MPKPSTTKTKQPGIYRRGEKYLYTYRQAGRQRWGTAGSLDEARRAKRQAEADVDRGELVELPTIRFGEYALDWVAHYQGRTANGFRESTRRSYRQMLERIIPFFDAQLRLKLAEIEPRDVKALVRWLIDLDHPRLGKSTIRQHVAVVRAVADVRVAAPLQEQVNDVRVPAGGGQVQRRHLRAPMAPGGVGIRAAVEQPGDGRGVAALGHRVRGAVGVDEPSQGLGGLEVAEGQCGDEVDRAGARRALPPGGADELGVLAAVVDACRLGPARQEMTVSAMRV